MKGKLFILDFDVVAVEAHEQYLYEDGWEVYSESVDNRLAFDKIKADQPDVVVIYLSAMPAYGRALADDLRANRETAGIPIVFVDGKDKAVKKAQEEIANAVFTTQEDILGELLRFVRREPGEKADIQELDH